MAAATYKPSRRVCASFLAASFGFGLLRFTANAEDQSVVWTNMVNVAAAGDTLQKTL